MRPQAAWIWASARSARRGSGTDAGSSASRRPGTNGIRITATAWGSSSLSRLVAVDGSGQPSLTTATTATWPPCRMTAATALVACAADHAVLRHVTTSARLLATTAGCCGFGSGRIAPISQAGRSQVASVVVPAPPWAPQMTSSRCCHRSRGSRSGTVAFSSA